MATVRRSLSLVVALAISCAVYGDDHYEVNFGTQIGTATPRPRPAGPAPTDDDGLPTEIVWTLPGAIDLDQDDAEERLFKANEDEEKASKKKPGDPDIDIVIDSDGS